MDAAGGGVRSVMSGLEDLPRLVTAVGGLGAAAFGLVDATKVFGGGVNHIGFGCIRRAVSELTAPGESGNALSQKQILAALEANWMSGTDLARQKEIAQSLIHLNAHPSNATVVTAILDEAYQRATQQYRNWTRAMAALFAVGLALYGGRTLGLNPVESLLIGFAAIPLAPISKDLSTALSVALRR